MSNSNFSKFAKPTLKIDIPPIVIASTYDTIATFFNKNTCSTMRAVRRNKKEINFYRVKEDI